MKSSDISQAAAPVQKDHLHASLHTKTTELILGTGRKS